MPKRIFLGRKKLLVEAIVERLCQSIPAGTPLPDFGQLAVVLPGMAARRAVQKSLAAKFGALLPPKLMMPSQLLHYGTPAGHPASAIEAELLWTRAVGKAQETPENFSSLFPGGKVELRRMPGKVFAQLREELARGGISIAEAAKELGSRGGELAELEKIFLAELAEAGFDDPLESDRRAASDVRELAKFDKIILAGVPDLPHMLKKRLQTLCAVTPELLEIWIHAPQTEATAFDDFGVPIAEVWENRTLPLPLDAIEVAVDARDAAVRARDFLVGSGAEFSPEQGVVALADPQLEECFIDSFSEIGRATGTPLKVTSSTGIPAGKLRLAHLGAALLDFLQNRDDFTAAAALLTERDFLAAQGSGKENEILAALDEFRLTRYPDDFNAALSLLRELAPSDAASRQLLPLFQQIARLPQELDESISVAAFLRHFFNRIFHRELQREEKTFGIPLGDEIEVFRRKLDEFDALPADLTDDAMRGAVIELFFQHFEAEAFPVGRGDMVLEGMLEIPFFTASRVALVGINEKYYPDRLAPTAFLTDSIRKKLHLRHNGDTFARAMCHLYSLLEPRPESDVKFFVLKHSLQKEVLKPSPLFFTGELPDDQLLARARHFFGEIAARPIASAGRNEVKKFTFDWESDEIRFFDGAPVLAVTAFKNYLSGAANFFFANVLRAEPGDYALAEPDASGFGMICHAAFEHLKGDLCDSEEMFFLALERNLRRYLREKFGETLPVLIQLQQENLIQRFRYAARDLERERRAGFALIETEYPFGGGTPIALGEGFVKGTADRIEYRAADNTLRILDIKTGKIDSVESEHYKPRKKQFINLQLPLYAILLRRDEEFARRHPEIDVVNAKIECGYFLLPRAVTESRIEIWDPERFNALLSEAEICAARVLFEVKRMKEKIFSGSAKRNVLSPALQQIISDLGAALPQVSWQEAENDGK